MSQVAPEVISSPSLPRRYSGVCVWLLLTQDVRACFLRNPCAGAGARVDARGGAPRRTPGHGRAHPETRKHAGITRHTHTHGNARAHAQGHAHTRQSARARTRSGIHAGIFRGLRVRVILLALVFTSEEVFWSGGAKLFEGRRPWYGQVDSSD